MPLVTSMPPLDGDRQDQGAARPRSRTTTTTSRSTSRSPRRTRSNDGVQFSCDNAPDNFNPDQEDMDEDGFGDIGRPVPDVAQDNNTGDTDKDGIGNSCDLCTRQPTRLQHQRRRGGRAGVHAGPQHPVQDDYDQDGIGDVCDNCIVKANCGDFGPKADGLRPAGISSTVPFDNDDVCQVDNDMVALRRRRLRHRAGRAAPARRRRRSGRSPHTDDFDQDGLANIEDKCPRIRSRVEDATRSGRAPRTTARPAPSAPTASATTSTPTTTASATSATPARRKATPSRSRTAACRGRPGRGLRRQPSARPTPAATSARRPPLAFYTKVANGQCCVMPVREDAGFTTPATSMIDEDTGLRRRRPGVPLSRDCPEDQENVTCRKLPKVGRSRPRRRHAAARLRRRRQPLTLDSPGINRDERRAAHVHVPHAAVDQDFDGIGDACDLCPYAFDPNNSFYKDENNKVWPNYGNVCRGVYDAEKGIPTCEDAARAPTPPTRAAPARESRETPRRAACAEPQGPTQAVQSPGSGLPSACRHLSCSPPGSASSTS
jgi:hypothetical protein